MPPGEQMPNTDPNITALVETFARQIAAAVEASTVGRVQAAFGSAAGVVPVACSEVRKRAWK
jgi:hypothetical protein